MDFLDIIGKAHENQMQNNENLKIKRYSTEVKPPKKPPKQSVNTDAIKKFLEKKNEEQRQKELEARKKKEYLLSLRAQNVKSNKKAKLMASRTKDNDFSRIKLSEEELEERLKRERELQNRMLNDKKERMKARLELAERDELAHKRGGKALLRQLEKEKQREEKISHHVDKRSDTDSDSGALTKHRKKRQRRFDDPLSFNPYQKDDEEKPEKAKSKKDRPRPRMGPPPMSFHDLLQLANKLKDVPTNIQKKVVKEERPMTREEKVRHMEQMLRKRQISTKTLPKEIVGKAGGKKPDYDAIRKSKSKTAREDPSRTASSATPASLAKKMSPPKQSLPSRPAGLPPKTSRPMQQPMPRRMEKRPLPDEDDGEDEEEEDDEEEEYDEEDEYEDDGFIDDGPLEEEVDYSQEIGKIFKYNKNNYVDDDDDDDDVMEASYAQQMFEEQRSAKIGMQEDLEEWRKEQEELKRKKLQKKAMKR